MTARAHVSEQPDPRLSSKLLCDCGIKAVTFPEARDGTFCTCEMCAPLSTYIRNSYTVVFRARLRRQRSHLPGDASSSISQASEANAIGDDGLPGANK